MNYLDLMSHLRIHLKYHIIIMLVSSFSSMFYSKLNPIDYPKQRIVPESYRSVLKHSKFLQLNDSHNFGQFQLLRMMQSVFF